MATPKVSVLETPKVPPHSLEAEQSVLGGLMLSASAWDHVADKVREADFYRDCAEQVDFSSHFFSTDAVVCELYDYVTENIEDDFGHGLEHVRKVAHDAGTLAMIEGQETEGDASSDSSLPHRVRLAQCAGLPHDIKRKHKNHANIKRYDCFALR